MKRAMCFDPGVTTGYSVVELGDDWATVIDAGEFNEFHLVRSLVDKYQPDYLLYESFHLVSTAIDKTPIEVIGAIKALIGADYPLIAVPPASRKFAVVRYGKPMFKDISSVHGKAATHHLVAWLYHKHAYRNFRVNLQ